MTGELTCRNYGTCKLREVEGTACNPTCEKYDRVAIDLSKQPEMEPLLGNEVEKGKRYRLGTDIDYSKAKPGCKHCGGRGIAGYTRRAVPEGVERVPIVCRCVSKRGGVKEDDFDRFMRQMSTEAYLNKIRIMPPCDEREKAIRTLEFDVQRPGLNDAQREYLRTWVAKLKAPAPPEA
jgi:hypothetical protein